VTPGRLRQLAEREDAAALRALDAGDAEQAREYRLLATLHREVAAEMERQGLPLLPKPRTVNSGMLSDEHKAALSASRPSRDKGFMKAVRAAGYSLNRLAETVGMSPSSLSQARRKPTDPLYRRIPEAKAKAIEGVIGWPASDWP
jgi:lambda repressor-like predicted transcriptional regulator